MFIIYLGLISGFAILIFSNALIDSLYTIINNAILSSGGNASWLLKTMKVIVGFFVYDEISFSCGFLLIAFSIFKIVGSKD